MTRAFRALIFTVGAICLSAASPVLAKDSADQCFFNWVLSLGAAIDKDPAYKRIPLENEKQNAAFTKKLRALYFGKISDDAFRSWVDDRYPGHAYELDTITRIAAQYRGTC